MNIYPVALFSVLSALSTCLAAQSAAQTEAGAPSGAQHTLGKSTLLPEVVVVGHSQRGAALGDVTPMRQFEADELQSYGVSTVGELLGALTPHTQGAGDKPIVLLNGRRISGMGVLQDLPVEAIEHLQVLPEIESLRYGYQPYQRVINIVLRKRFRALTVEAEAAEATKGGAETGKADVGFTRIQDDTRFSLDLKYQDDSILLASQRGLTVAPDMALRGLGGVTNLAPYESLRPSTQTTSINAVFSRPVGLINATLDASVKVTRARSDQGLANVGLIVPAGDPFSTSSEEITIDRYLTETSPLTQSTQTVTSHLGLSLDWLQSNWAWSLTAAGEHSDAQTLTEIGVDTSGVQSQLSALSPTLDPFAPLPATLLSSRLADRAGSISDSGNLDLVLNGDLGRLPAGPISTTLSLGSDVTRLASRASQPGLDQATTLAREEGRTGLTLDIPLTSKGRNVLPALGDVSANLGFAIDGVSNFGALTSYTIGMNWTPLPQIDLGASWETKNSAPSMANLNSPTITTPNVPAFDYVSGQSVQVTELTGGDPQLKPSRNEVGTLKLFVAPLAKLPLTLLATYTHTRIRNFAETLPVATAAIEAAFPDRFIRDAAGQLVEIDACPVDFDSRTSDQLRWGFNYSFPLPAASAHSHPVRANPTMVLSIFDTWVLRDNIIIRPGLPTIDLLNGGSILSGGGQPAHTVEAQLGIARQSMGGFLEAKWKSATWLNNSSPAGDLYYSDIITLNLRLFADLGQSGPLSGAGWTHGLRATLSIDNFLDSRQSVHNGLDQTPEAFQPAYLDPVGRLIHIELHKIF